MCVSTAALYGKIAPAAPHALHMPSHIYSMLGMWEDSIRSNLASTAVSESYGRPVAHQTDFLVYAYLQRAEDGRAKELVDSVLPISGGLGSATALAAIPARFALERGQWDEAVQLDVRSSEFPAARSISYFARALGAARSGNAAAARAEIAHLDEIEAKLAAANDDYWAGQIRIQKQAAIAWVMFSEGQRDEAIAAMRKAADLDDASEKTVAMENKLVPIRELLGELYLLAGMDKEALVELRRTRSCRTAFERLRRRQPRPAPPALSRRQSGITARSRHLQRMPMAIDRNSPRRGHTCRKTEGITTLVATRQM
jgi:hypothetical protein